MVALAAALVALTMGCSSPSAGRAHATATFEVADKETFRIELDTPELVDHVRRLLRGEEVPAIPNGVVVRDDPAVNTPWSWHIDPSTLEFADMTTEVCDGLPSDVEAGSITSDRYCPWLVKVIDISD